MAYLFIDRKLFESEIWAEKPFSPGQAWIDIIGLAAWKDTVLHNGMEIKRGQFFTTLRTLATRWGWGKDKVSSFLCKMETRHRLLQNRDSSRDTGGTLITIVNYNHYQALPLSTGTRTDTEQTQNQTQNRHRCRLEEGNTMKSIKKRESLFDDGTDSDAGDIPKGTAPEPGEKKPETMEQYAHRVAKFSGWGCWIEACRHNFRPDPAKIPEALKHSKTLGDAVTDRVELIESMSHFLNDKNDWFVNTGHRLRDLVPAIDKYRAMYKAQLRSFAEVEKREAEERADSECARKNPMDLEEQNRIEAKMKAMGL